MSSKRAQDQGLKSAARNRTDFSVATHFHACGVSRSGSLGLIVALALPCMIGLVGGGIDYARYVTFRQNAQNAADESVIELANYILRNRMNNMPEVQRDAIATRIFRDHLGPEVKSWFEVNTVRDTETAVTTLLAKSILKTQFLQIIGLREFELAAVSKAKFDFKTYAVEFAFVVNVGTSMRTERKKRALSDAFETIFNKFREANKASKDRVRVSIVPFGLGVNMPKVNPQQYVWPDMTADPTSTCVIDRLPPYAYKAQPVQPNVTGTKYPLAKAEDADSWCPTKPVLPMTTDLAAARAAIPDVAAAAGVNGAVGLAWGLNMLTPGAPGSNSGKTPLSRDQTTLRRVLVYMTDGENTGNASGRGASVVDDWSLQLCSQAKANDIEVISINIDGAGSESFLQACASSKKYRKVPVADLPKMLDDVVEDATGWAPVRLVE